MGRRFAKNFDPPLSRRLDHGIRGEHRLVGRVREEQIAHLNHVEETILVAPHNSTASLSTRSETRARRAVSVTTSTE